MDKKEKIEKILEVKNLCKYFKTQTRIFKAVDELSFSLEQGVICGFVGPNGAGKTTTIKMLVGATFSTNGEIIIGGNKIPSLKSRSLIGYIPEKFVFYDEMLPEDYLIYLAEISGINKQEAQKRAVQILKMLELYEHNDKKVGTFSSGMKQKLSLAQAMIHNPKLLILDEPIANLDPVAKHQFLDILKNLVKEKGISVFISSHHLEELEKIIDKVVIINKGKLIVESYMKELTSKKKKLEIEVSNPKKIAGLIQQNLNLAVGVEENKLYVDAGKYDLRELKKYLMSLIMNSGEEIISISTKTQSLDNLFLELLKK